MSTKHPNEENPTVQSPQPAASSEAPDVSRPVTVRVDGSPQRLDGLLKSLEGAKPIPEFAARIIWEELCFRRDLGDATAVEDFLKRHPEWRPELEKLQERSAWGEAIPYPDAGAEIAGYQLVGELGRGAQGVVFLARQISLASRPVVLKITACEGVEHLRLARLQHTNIVPLFGVEEIPERNLRLMCMPFLGAITLADLLKRLKSVPGPVGGKEVNEILENVQSVYSQDLPRRGNVAAALGELSYIAFVCRLGFFLAEALDYAHNNGIVHLDIKPSNILLAPDGRPLLLDFHLARTPIQAGEKTLGGFGGTLRYMSPEQRDAMAAVTSGQGIPSAVDHRSDLYSLGLVLFEALGGTRSAREKAEPAKLPGWNPSVTKGLVDILAKCLAEKSADRYADARALAEDLDRHVKDRPLVGVANRSWRERFQKWRRRSPLALRLYGLAFALAVAGVATGTILFSQYQDRRQGAEIDLVEGKALLERNRFEDAGSMFRRGQERIAAVPGAALLKRNLSDHERLAQYLHKAQELHTTVNTMRFLALIEPLPERSLFILDVGARNLWKARAEFALLPEIPLELDIKNRVNTDLRDLALLRAELQVRLASPAQKRAANQAALQVLDEAERTFGKHPAILLEQHRYALALGQKQSGERPDANGDLIAPQTPWEFAFVARSHLRDKAFAKAEDVLRQAIQRYPLHPLPQFYQGYCSYRQGKYAHAVSAFSFCLGQEPRSETFFFRGLCHATQGQKDLALADFDQALERDPTLGPALFERGMLHQAEKRWEAATQDFERALLLGIEPNLTRCELAQVHIAQQNWAAARSVLDQVLVDQPGHERARILRKSVPD